MLPPRFRQRRIEQSQAIAEQDRQPGNRQFVYQALAKGLGYEAATVEVDAQRAVRAMKTETVGRRALSTGIQYCAASYGSCPRRYSSSVRLNSQTGLPSWFVPVVLTVSRPLPGREFDSRLERISLRA